MKHISAVQTIFSDPKRQHSLYLSKSGLLIWDVFLDVGIGEESMIGHLSDIHYNYCNFRDLDEEDPVLMSTLEHRHWLAGGASVPKARRCLEFLDDADQIVINGDTLAGVLGLCEAILRALAVAIGFAAMLMLTGG